MRTLSLRQHQDTSADRWLYRLLEHHVAGRARFPALMGLTPGEYSALARRVGLETGERSLFLQQQDALLSMLMRGRLSECHALADWLSQSMQPDAAPINHIIATACMGFNHLWQDLGLATRGELRELMQDCFPPLVAANHDNMRWKKFFYRQICLLETGDVSCRSPSCDACRERESCFAPED